MFLQTRSLRAAAVSASSRRFRPAVEMLEDRCLLTGTFLQTNLVSDIPGLAANTDPNLVNAWGVAFAPNGPFWIANNGSGTSTLYNGSGTPFPQGMPLVVTIPPPSNMPTATAAPTGTVFNGTSGFVVGSGSMSGPAAFLFATEDGTISGWNPMANPTKAILEVDNLNTSTGPVFKGLALGTNSTGTFLFATDFRNGTVDVFNSTFQKTTLSGSFKDTNLPAGFAPFGIQNIGGQLFVTFAKQDSAKHDDVAGSGNGFVDVFDTNGNLVRRFASGGSLNSPWGLTMAPSNFGAASNDLLVGNFGDGRINVFNPSTGAFLGQLGNLSGTPITIDGLWSLTFGNGSNAGSTNTLFFTAGPQMESHGLFGSLTATNAVFVTGTDGGGGPQVAVFDAQTGALLKTFFAFASSFTGGVRVAVGDVNGDGVPDIVAGAGPGGGPQITVFDGKTFQPILSFSAFAPSFSGGVFVAVGNVEGPGIADIIVGADAGGGPQVAIFNATTGKLVRSFFAFAPGFTGGVRVASADINNDGFADIVTAAGRGGGPQVTIFNGMDGSIIRSFNAFASSFTGGVFVATADTDGDGQIDIITGAGAGGGPQVALYDGGSFNLMSTFFAYAPMFTGGVRVAGTPFTATGPAEVLTGAGPGGGPQATIFDSQSMAVLDSVFATTSSFTGGIFVAG